ncbi:MAG: putative nucleic acid-binding Zn-ribbon protein [Akkermansiaceae bacterium]|jgi:predicted  nucleic acid-binding Zn-ribbon protein
MTRTRYTIASFLQYFGVGRKVKRLTDASFEMHLMQDGEEILGAYCWRNIEDIEELSMEYWNIRRLEREGKVIIDKVREAEEVLSGAQMERSGFLDRTKDTGQELLNERESVFDQIEKLNRDRDDLMASAIQTKRKYSALKMKAKVLKEEGLDDKVGIHKCREDLAKLKGDFTSEKEGLSEINSRISTLEKTLEAVQAKINNELEGSKGEAVEAFTRISRSNRDIATLKAELGLVQDEQAALFRDIGRFLNINSTRSDCRMACREHRGVQEQTRLLYRSVEMNRKLIEKMGG